MGPSEHKMLKTQDVQKIISLHTNSTFSLEVSPDRAIDTTSGAFKTRGVEGHQ